MGKGRGNPRENAERRDRGKESNSVPTEKVSAGWAVPGAMGRCRNRTLLLPRGAL